MMLWLFMVVGLVPTALGYSRGSPSERCDNMTPGHSAQLQTGSAPFEITFSPDKTTYSANEQIQVTLKGIGGQKFKGFLIQPRPSADTYMTYGSIETYPDGSRNPCGNERVNKNVALTHDSSVEKSFITFTWRAPSSDSGNIVFVFSVVQKYDTFWVKLTSAPLTYASDGLTQQPTTKTTQQPTIKTTQQPTTKTNTQTDPPTNPPTGATTKTTQQPTTKTNTQTDPPTNPPTGATTGAPGDQINRDPACGVTKSCFPGASECSQDCNYLITWIKSGPEEVEFTLQRKTTENNYWIAIGLSDDPKMGNDSVTECVSYDGEVAVMVSYNDETYKMNRRLDTPTFGIRFISGSYRDGILSCNFARKKTAELASSAFGRRRREVADETTFFDLGKEWYLLVAHGQSRQGSLMKHSEYPKISPMKIDFLTLETDTGTTPAMSDKGVIVKDSRCGESLGCYHDCNSNGDSCGFLLTWMENGDDMDLTLTCKRPGNNVYCAVGLSNDDKMGDDSVFECVSSGGTASVYVSYNDGRSNVRLTEGKFGLSSELVTHSDGVLSCKFMRKKTAALASANLTGRRKRAISVSPSTYFDMTKDWTLLYAYGSSIGGSVGKHDTLPAVSTQKADFQKFLDLSASAPDRTLVKLHGILMTAAWMFFAVLGIFMARFYKLVWPEGMEWCDQKRWFIIHRSCMVMAFLLTAASFVVIFVHVGGYAQIQGSNFEKSHPIIGIVVMSLALINPIMAVFRPHPGTSKRPAFNVAHKLVGTAAAVCSIVNIFSGTILAGAFVPAYVRIILWVTIGWCGLIELVSYVYDCRTNKERREESYQLKSLNESVAKQQQHQSVPQFKIAVLWLHVLILLGMTVAVCIILAINDGVVHDH